MTKYPTNDEQLDVARMVCEKFFLYSSTAMEDYPGLQRHLDVRINQVHDHVNRCVIFLRGWMLEGHKVVRKECHTVEFPSSPWQFFKERHFPAWALERWPVKKTSQTFDVAEHHHYICPHLVTDENLKHIMFMYEGSKGDGPQPQRVD